MYQPLISIIIPCYNNRNFILEAIDSALNQTYPHIEVIVVDDGSTDHSYEFVADNLKGQSNLHLIRQENQGPAGARNTGFNLAAGDFLVFLDGDDILHREYVENCYREYVNNPKLNIVYCDVELFENKTGPWKLKPFSPETILLYNSIPVFAMIRSSVFQQIGRYDTELRCAEDWELWIRILQQYEGVYKIPKVLYYYRKRNEKTSITDYDKIYNFRHDALLYIYIKHQQVYRDSNLDMTNLFSCVVYKERYYNEWYRKLFYRLFKRKRYAEIYNKKQALTADNNADWYAPLNDLKAALGLTVRV